MTLDMTLSQVCFVRPGQAVGKRPHLTGTGDHRAPCYRPASPAHPAGRGQLQRWGRAGRSRPAFPAFQGQRAPWDAAPSSTARARGQSAAGSPPRGGGARRGPARGQGSRAPGGGGRAEENRRGEPHAQHGAAGARGSRRGREAGAGPGPAFPARPRGHVRPRSAAPRGPAPARRRRRGLTRGGAARAERSRAGSARGGRRERRPRSGGGGGRGLGARPPSPPSPLPSARCAERGAREAPVTAARASAASSAVRGGGGGRRGPAQLSGPGAEKAAEMMPVSENGESSRRRSPAWRRAAGRWDASPFPAGLPAADGVRGAAVIPGPAGTEGCGAAETSVGSAPGVGPPVTAVPGCGGARPAPAPPPAGVAPTVTGREPRPPELWRSCASRTPVGRRGSPLGCCRPPRPAVRRRGCAVFG